MGLDMYLTARIYTSEYSNSEIYDAAKETKIPWPVTDMEPGSFDFSKVVIYWRKANAIHKWFVDNCQGGVDDCREAHVSLSKLTELRDLCMSALKEQSTDILPTKSGFFFGNTEYDAYYWEDIRDTEKALTQILENPHKESFIYYYSSSW